ncbi:hypothetical protein [Fischerella thermalis]|uniref:hypothetical protein n=1 Tax=Fischerella thermalis TaxID=372787 RepID=UPI0019EBBF97|nr:hypothetical protein [Fischerella thermalis]MBF1991070.1 hypothetical protein [Fischerella thermalis M58_A2018_009]MBF2059772.1 hypothetical protein [Fischerella thermalis M66_A2018_004]
MKVEQEGRRQKAEGSPDETCFIAKDERGFFSYIPKSLHPYTLFRGRRQKAKMLVVIK